MWNLVLLWGVPAKRIGNYVDFIKKRRDYTIEKRGTTNIDF